MLAITQQARTAVPHLEELSDYSDGSGEQSVVCRVAVGGIVGDGARGSSLVLRTGDRLLAVGTPRVGELCILLPRGRGRPLVGRVTHGGLIAEPSGVPCCTNRWRVAGRLVVQAAQEPRGLVLPFRLRIPAPSSNQLSLFPATVG